MMSLRDYPQLTDIEDHDIIDDIDLLTLKKNLKAALSNLEQMDRESNQELGIDQA